MKLTHLALIMTLALVGVTGWLAWDQHSDARGARNQLELLQRQRNGTATDGNDLHAKETQMLMAQMAAKQNAATKKEPALPLPAKINSNNQVATTMVTSGHVSADSLAASPPPLTPRQKLLMSLPAIGKVAESQQQYGFVVITAGANKKLERGSVFALRRGKSVVGRIKVTEIENTSAIANLQPGTVPVGVDVQMGDDVVQDLPPES